MTLSEEEHLTEILTGGDAYRALLSPWERGFLADQIARYEAEGADMWLSKKQWECLERIGDKVNPGNRFQHD